MKSLFLTFLLLGASQVCLAQSATDDCGTQQVSAGQELYNQRLKTVAEDMSLSLLQYLNANVHQVALVSRAGSDLSDQKFRDPTVEKYSHTGIALKDPSTGAWSFVHELNDCDGPTSKVYHQGLAEFFTDDPYMLDISILVPSLALQQKIAKVLLDKAQGGLNLADVLHDSAYSEIANPFSNKYQNSDMWVLAVISSAQSGAQSLNDAEEAYRKKGYQPSQVYVDGLEALFGPLFIKNAKTDDHTAEESSTGWYNFVSSESLETYVKQSDRPLASKELCPKQGCGVPVKGKIIPDTTGQ